MYDLLLVGAGLYNAVIAYNATKAGKKCLVIDKRETLGGNLYCDDEKDIHVHTYGAHIFHTSNKEVWDFVNSLTEFNRYTNSPIANYKGELYNLPFNMNTFHQLWGINTPDEAKKIIDEQKKAITGEPKNLKEQAISLVGTDIYKKLVEGYTEKQWGKKCEELPAFIIKRLPVRYTFNNNYFNDKYQGIPQEGYNPLIRKLFEGCDIKLGEDYLANRSYYDSCAKLIVYTGTIDEYFDYSLGELEYRSLRFEHERMDIPNYMGCAVMNFTEAEVPYTRMIEHCHFYGVQQEYTIVTHEYPATWEKGLEPYYPVNDDRNNELYKKYVAKAEEIKDKIVFGGRLGMYKYLDMDKIIEEAMKKSKEIVG